MYCNASVHHSFDPISKTLNTYIVIWEFTNIIHGMTSMTMHTSNHTIVTTLYSQHKYYLFYALCVSINIVTLLLV